MMLRVWKWTIWREEYSICCKVGVRRKQKWESFMFLLFATFLILNLTSATKEPLTSSDYQALMEQGRCSTPAKDHNSSASTHHKNRLALCLLTARKFPGTRPVPNDELIPEWINHTLFSIGQSYATKNVGYIGISHFFALIFENFIPDIKDVLLTTGSTSSLHRAVKRYTATATQVMLWYRNSLQVPQEKEIVLGSWSMVRKLHVDGAMKVMEKMQKHGENYLESRQKDILQELWFQQQVPRSIVFDERFWEALQNDLLSSDVPKNKRQFPEWKNVTSAPISQFAQGLTQFSFVGLPVLFHKELGISQVTREELHGFIHMWAVFGHAIGIKDEFNICLNDSFEESIKLFRDIFNTFFLPAMFKFDWRVRVQLGAYLDALHHMDNMITPRLIMFRFLRDIVKIQPLNMFRQMSVIERMYLATIDSLLSNNLEANRFFLNQGSTFFLDVNGYNSFGSYYSSDAGKSKGAFYTRDKLMI